MDDTTFSILNEGVLDEYNRCLALGIPTVRMGGIYYPLKDENGTIIRDIDNLHTQKQGLDILLGGEKGTLKDYFKRTE